MSSHRRQIDTTEAMFRRAANTALEVLLSLLALEQGGTSSPISQVTLIINSLSRDSASLLRFFFCFYFQ